MCFPWQALNSFFVKKGTSWVANEREADLSITTDSVLSWLGNEQSGTWVSGAPFIGQADLFSNPFYVWGLTGDGTPNSFQAQLQENDDTLYLGLDFPGLAADANTADKTSTIRVTVTDANDTETPILHNSFMVRWHLPYEGWHTTGRTWDVYEWPMVEPASPGYARRNGGVACTWYYGDPMDAFWSETGGYLLGIMSASPNPYLASLFTILQAGEPSLQQDAGTAIFNDCWGAEGSTYFPDKDEALMQLGWYTMKPRVKIPYTIYPYAADSYNQNGYAGLFRKPVGRKNGPGAFVGDFERGDDGPPDHPNP